jgi:predicted nucleic acid-binding protein
VIATKSVMVDSGFWLGLFDPQDQYHVKAKTVPVELDKVNVVVPWPTLYETLSTRFVRDPRRVALLGTVLRRANIVLLSDVPYRDAALSAAVDAVAAGRYRALSLVDRVIRLTLEDVNVRISALVTFNPNDFRDVCVRRGIELLPAA